MVQINNNWGTAKLPSLPTTTKITPNAPKVPKTTVQPLQVYVNGVKIFDDGKKDKVVFITYTPGKTHSHQPGYYKKVVTDAKLTSSNNNSYNVNTNSAINSSFFKKVN